MNEVEREMTEMVNDILEKDQMKDEFLRNYDEAISEAMECLNTEAAGSSERKNEAEVLERLVKAKVALMQYESDVRDKEERRRIDEQKNKDNALIEREKAKKPISDKLWDIGGKVLIGLLSSGASMVMLKMILEFEENGSLRSKPGREFRIFKPWF